MIGVVGYVVAVLTSALQEQQRQIDELTGRVAALEAP